MPKPPGWGLRGGRTGSTGPMDRTCVSTGRFSRKPAVPRRLNAPTPNVGDRRGGNPRTNGVSSCTVTQARRASRDGSSSLSLNPASDAVYVGAEVESAR